MTELVVVTGATGHLGQALVRRLVEDGRTVRAVGAEPLDQPLEIDALPIERQQVDVRDRAQVDAAIAGADVVFHLAAKVSIASKDPDVGPINVGGTANVLAACTQHGVRRLVHVSSINALVPSPGVLVEDRALALDAPVPYDRSKAEGELQVRRAIEGGLDAVIVYPTGILGPGDVQRNNLNRMLADLWRHRLPASIPGGFDWVDVRDVVEGMLAAERAGRPGGRYVLSGNWASVRELVAVAAAERGGRSPRLTMPRRVARLAAGIVEPIQRATGAPLRFTAGSLAVLEQHEPIDARRTRAELGYAPRPLAETIADTHRWMVATGVLAQAS